MKNRYNFAKICYKEYVILILKNRKLYTYNEEGILYNFKYINKLKELHINYVILDNLDIIKREYNDNGYKEYYYKYKINKLLDLIIDRRKDGSISEENSNKLIDSYINCVNSNIYS